MFMNTRLNAWNDSITGINTQRKRGHATHSGAAISNTVITGSPPCSMKLMNGHSGTCQPTPVLK